MKKLGTFILMLTVFILACGNKYDGAIDKALNAYNESRENDLKRKDADILVYEDGNIIGVSNGDVSHSFYIKNDTSGKYKFDSRPGNMSEKDYMKSHKPDYKEENIKK